MSIRIKADASAEGEPLAHFWSRCVGAGRANEGLRANWQEHLNLVADHCGFRAVRFHGLFHDDMFVYREKNGRASYNWQYVDELFDRILASGVRPFVELGFCPGELATQKATVFWWNAHGSPPSNYGAWAELVTCFVAHCLERYGRQEVLKWDFEVWNEPNLRDFFRGTREQYFELYRVTSEAVKRVDKELRVGGPATSNFVSDGRFDGEKEGRVSCPEADIDKGDFQPIWVKEFLDFCARNRLPLDFVSTHPYPTDVCLDLKGESKGVARQVSAIRQDMQKLRRIVKDGAYPRAEIHLTEWNSSPSSRDHQHDYPQEAAYIAKTCMECAGLADSLSYWTFTDVFEENGSGDSVFHGGFGLVNFQGIVKPAFHAYRFLNALGDREIARGHGWILTRHRDTGRVAAMACHYPPEVRTSPAPASERAEAKALLDQGKPAELSLNISGVKPAGKFEVEILDREHGFAIPEWERLGSPEPPDRAQTAELRRIAMETRRERLEADQSGALRWRATLSPWSVVLVREV